MRSLPILTALLLTTPLHAADPEAPPRRPGENYPAAAASAGQHGSTIVGFDIVETGKVEHCTVVRSSGAPVLDAAACHLIEEGTVFKVDKPVAERRLETRHSETTVHWLIAGATPGPNDLPIAANDIAVPHDPTLAARNRGQPVGREPIRQPVDPDALPEGLADGRGGATAAVLMVDPNGRVTSCGLVRTSGTQELDKATCDFARRVLRYRPAIDPAGRPVHGLDLFKFDWTPAAAPPAESSTPSNP